VTLSDRVNYIFINMIKPSLAVLALIQGLSMQEV